MSCSGYAAQPGITSIRIYKAMKYLNYIFITPTQPTDEKLNQQLC